jgi:hypothetical protein
MTPEDTQQLEAARKRIPSRISATLLPGNNEEEDLHLMMFGIVSPDEKEADMMFAMDEDPDCGWAAAAQRWLSEGWAAESKVSFIGYAAG